jgi:hypothetical protein
MDLFVWNLFFLYKKNRMNGVKKPNMEEVLYKKNVAGEKWAKKVRFQKIQ